MIFRDGIRQCLKAARICETFQLGAAVHSSGEPGFQLATMLHLGAVIPNLSFAADAHYHHLIGDFIEGGRFDRKNGKIEVPTEADSRRPCWRLFCFSRSLFFDIFFDKKASFSIGIFIRDAASFAAAPVLVLTNRRAC